MDLTRLFEQPSEALFSYLSKLPKEPDRETKVLLDEPSFELLLDRLEDAVEELGQIPLDGEEQPVFQNDFLVNLDLLLSLIRFLGGGAVSIEGFSPWTNRLINCVLKVFTRLTDLEKHRQIVFFLNGRLVDKALAIFERTSRLNDGAFKSLVVRTVFAVVFNVIVDRQIGLITRKSCVVILNDLIDQCNLQMLEKTIDRLPEEGDSFVDVFSSLGSAVVDCGDFCFQVSLVELLCRILPSSDWTKERAAERLWPAETRSAFLAIDYGKFEQDARAFLIALNDASNPRSVYSYACEYCRLSQCALTPPTSDSDAPLPFWVDFNLGSASMSIYHQIPGRDEWETFCVRNEDVADWRMLSRESSTDHFVLEINLKREMALEEFRSDRVSLGFAIDLSHVASQVLDAPPRRAWTTVACRSLQSPETALTRFQTSHVSNWSRKRNDCKPIQTSSEEEEFSTSPKPEKIGSLTSIRTPPRPKSDREIDVPRSNDFRDSFRKKKRARSQEILDCTKVGKISRTSNPLFLTNNRRKNIVTDQNSGCEKRSCTVQEIKEKTNRYDSRPWILNEDSVRESQSKKNAEDHSDDSTEIRASPQITRPETCESRRKREKITNRMMKIKESMDKTNVSKKVPVVNEENHDENYPRHCEVAKNMEISRDAVVESADNHELKSMSEVEVTKDVSVKKTLQITDCENLKNPNNADENGDNSEHTIGTPSECSVQNEVSISNENIFDPDNNPEDGLLKEQCRENPEQHDDTMHQNTKITPNVSDELILSGDALEINTRNLLENETLVSQEKDPIVNVDINRSSLNGIENQSIIEIEMDPVGKKQGSLRNKKKKINMTNVSDNDQKLLVINQNLLTEKEPEKEKRKLYTAEIDFMSQCSQSSQSINNLPPIFPETLFVNENKSNSTYTSFKVPNEKNFQCDKTYNLTNNGQCDGFYASSTKINENNAKRRVESMKKHQQKEIKAVDISKTEKHALQTKPVNTDKSVFDDFQMDNNLPKSVKRQFKKSKEISIKKPNSKEVSSLLQEDPKETYTDFSNPNETEALLRDEHQTESEPDKVLNKSLRNRRSDRLRGKKTNYAESPEEENNTQSAVESDTLHKEPTPELSVTAIDLNNEVLDSNLGELEPRPLLNSSAISLDIFPSQTDIGHESLDSHIPKNSAAETQRFPKLVSSVKSYKRSVSRNSTSSKIDLEILGVEIPKVLELISREEETLYNSITGYNAEIAKLKELNDEKETIIKLRAFLESGDGIKAKKILKKRSNQLNRVQ